MLNAAPKRPTSVYSDPATNESRKLPCDGLCQYWMNRARLSS